MTSIIGTGTVSLTSPATFIKRVEYDGSNNPIYVGIASPGTATSASQWQIQKIAYTSNNPVSVLFADGDDSFDNIWDNRASLSYS